MSAIEQYAREAVTMREYKERSRRAVTEFEQVVNEKRSEVRQAMSRLGVEAVEVPIGDADADGVVPTVWVQRVAKQVPGAMTANRLQEYATRMLTREEIAALRAAAEEVAREEAERAAKERAKEAESAAKEERKRKREEGKAAREAAKASRVRHQVGKAVHDSQVRSLARRLSRES